MNLQSTEPPKNLRIWHRRCTQSQCGFYLNGGCHDCETCKARPYEINTECNRCLNCENILNSLRWDNNELQEEMEETIRQNVMEQQSDGVILMYQSGPKRKREEEILR